MTNLEIHPLTRHPGMVSPSERPAPASGIRQRVRSTILRYFYYSGGIASAALGLAMLISVLAVSQTSTPPFHGASLAEAAEREPPVYFQYAAEVSPLEEQLAAPVAEEVVSLDSAVLPVEAVPTRAAVPPRAPIPVTGVRVNSVMTHVNITFYDCLNDGFCGAMYNGEQVYEGAAACSWNLPIGTAFYIIGDPTGRVYICKDRGLLDDTWVDIFWNNPVDGYYWQSSVGRYGSIVLVSLPE
jgi:hypothetical protein